MVHQCRKDGLRWKHIDYLEEPAALEITTVTDMRQNAAAIIGWTIKIGNDTYEGGEILSLIDRLKAINEYLVGNLTLIIFCSELKYLCHYLSGYINLDLFDCNGKGIAVATYGHIELREVKFISENWKEYSNKKSTVDILYDYSKFYLNEVAMRFKRVQGKMPITAHQVITTMMRKNMDDSDKELVRSIFPRTADGYKLAKEKTYIGGYCGCATTEELNETLGHVDFDSSYIAQALTNYYPMSKFENADISEFNHNLKTKCCLISVTFKNLKAGKHIFLAKKHANGINNPEYSNTSKILSADEVTFLLTEMDFELVTNLYSYKSYTINNYLVADRGPLPDYVTSVAEQVYARKTLAIKGTPERTWAKALTENVYGAMDSPIYEGKTWKDIRDSAVASPYWAIWMISHARFALMTTAMALGNDFVYSDTDSLFFKNPYLHVQLIEQYNRSIRAKVELYCLKHGLDFNIYKNLGTFKYEENATPEHFTVVRFKACGPKRYIYVYDDGTRNVETKIAGYKKQYSVNGKLVNAWSYYYRDEDDLFEAFEDYNKIKDIRTKRELINEPRKLIYDGKVYVSRKCVLDYDEKTNTSAVDRLTELLDTEEELQRKQKLLGKIKVF